MTEGRHAAQDSPDCRALRAIPREERLSVDVDQLASVVDKNAKRLAGVRGPLLPLLHAVQEEIGWISDDAVALVANALNLSRAEVHGVVTFYPDFRRERAGTHVVKICRAEACQARGGAAIEAAAIERFGVAMGATRQDRRVTLEPIYCLGLCATGPNALVNGRPVSRIDKAALDQIADRILA